MPRLPSTNRFTAEVGAFVTRHPLFRELLSGRENPRVRLIDFRVARTPGDELGLPIFKGDSAEKRRRPEWPIGVLAVNAAAFSSELGKPKYQRGRRAFVCALGPEFGNVALVGAIPGHDLYLWNEGKPQIGGHVGKHDVGLGAAIWLPNDKLLVPEGGLGVAPILDVVSGTSVKAEPDDENRYTPQYSGVDQVPQTVSLY